MPAAVESDFVRETDQYRRELLAHCYRMLGSIHEAEDLVQESYLRAWRSYEKFEERSSTRTWLYRIATNACLTAIEQRGRRPLPTGLGGPTEQPLGELVADGEVPWLEPVPSDALGINPSDPASVAAAREGTRLAFIAALQHLPPNQRVVLILREVLAWKASEVAQLLEISVASVNSALQRARAQLDKVQPHEDEVTDLDDPKLEELLDRYVVAFERKDMAMLQTILKEDAVWEMPPFLSWYIGRETIGTMIDHHCPGGPGDIKLLWTIANGQPAYGIYVRLAPDQPFTAFNLHVLSFTGDEISKVVAFFDTTLFAKFGLPDVHPDPA